MNSLKNAQWTVAEHPQTTLEAKHFAYQETSIPDLEEGEVLLRTHLLNIAPVMRMYMMGESQAGEIPLSVGDVIHGRGVAEVMESRHPGFAVGEYVQGQMGWQTYKVSTMSAAEKFRKLPKKNLPIHYALSIFGITGFSAYFGFFNRGEPKPCDQVLISGAAGGVGSLVVQLAKLHGCARIVGMAATQAKCELIERLGCHASINYRDDRIEDAISSNFPNGIDLYFDNVGGVILNTSLANLAYNARVVLCGSIAEYQLAERHGPANYTSLRAKNADMRGFFVYNHQAEFDAAEDQMADWVSEGKLEAVVDLVQGFDQMPNALIGMYTGTGGGKRIVNLLEGSIARY